MIRCAPAVVLICAAALAPAAQATSSDTATADGPTELRAEVDCGTVNAEGFPFDVHVTKGHVPCPKAEEVARKDLGERSCGSQKLPACVSHGFHCREATAQLQTRTGIAGFCYTLKDPLPPSKDLGPYQLSRFTRAITIYVGAGE